MKKRPNELLPGYTAQEPTPEALRSSIPFARVALELAGDRAVIVPMMHIISRTPTDRPAIGVLLVAVVDTDFEKLASTAHAIIDALTATELPDFAAAVKVGSPNARFVIHRKDCAALHGRGLCDCASLRGAQ